MFHVFIRWCTCFILLKVCLRRWKKSLLRTGLPSRKDGTDGDVAIVTKNNYNFVVTCRLFVTNTQHVGRSNSQINVLLFQNHSFQKITLHYLNRKLFDMVRIYFDALSKII